MAIMFQPVVEPDFWNKTGNFWLWILNATFGYLIFGIFIWLGKSLIDIRKNSISTNALAVIAVAVVASMARSFSIGSLMEPLGLEGVSSLERLPFGAVLGFAWVFTSSLIMDTKYRFKFHLEEVVSVQRTYLDRIHKVQGKIFENIKLSTKASLEKSHRQLQQAIRELAILSNSNSIWASLVPQLRIATLRLALAAKKENWTADKDFNEVKSTRLQAIREIATKPLMNLSLVITATAVVTFFGGIRLYPVDFVVTSIIVTLGLHVAIILGTRIIIHRQSQPSTFSFAVMLAALFLTSALLSTIPGYLGYDRASLLGIALAATTFEVVWLIASGYVIFNQNQRQAIIANAQLENERLQDAIQFIEIVKSDFEKSQYKPTESLDLISEQINRALVDSNLQLSRGALEFSSILFGEIADLLSGTSETSIEQALNRVSTTSAATTEVLWTITGSQIPDSLQPRISAALEICVSKAIRHGEANVVSIDVRGSQTGAEIKVTDNGHAHDDGGIGLGVEILLELSGDTWERNRAGGLNIVTAQFSDK
jgi:signal transduction histidine kinase